MNRSESRRLYIRQHRCAFSLIEILIVVVILGILAAIVLPQFSNASHIARENTLKDDLRYLRTQISVYKAQHRDSPPGYPNGDIGSTPTEELFVQQMTMYTDEYGETSAVATAQHRFGPYLMRMPVNPLNNKTGIHVIASGEMPTPGDDVKDSKGQVAGWIYKPQTLEIAPNLTGSDYEGTPYFKY